MSFEESLRALVEDGDAVVGFVAAAVLVLVLTPLIARLAPLIGGLDDKADRPRVHRGAIPRIGGLAIVAGILVPTAVLIDLQGPYLGIFIGTLLVAALGLVDDLRGVTPSRKLVGVTLVALVAVDGVLKTAAAITLVAPLLVLAVPILDTSFVVLKRLKYRRPPWRADHNHFYHRFMRIGYSQRRTAAYLHLWALMMAGYALLARFVPPRPRGDWDLERSLLLTGVGLLVIGASVWMVYSLEILKARHLQAIGLKRFGGAEAAEALEPEPEEAVER